MPIGVIPALPLIGFLVLLLLGRYLSRQIAVLVGVGAIILACVATLILGYQSYMQVSNFQYARQILWTWIPFYASDYADATIQFALYLDSLSMLMITVVTFVGSLIALFSVSFMEDDEDIGRFFACMNLFVSSMLVLVLADNLLVLYMGWEGVGLCSYLLVGFWYQNPATGRASMKAFITTRIGDVFLLFAILLIFMQLGTLSIQEVLMLSPHEWTFGSVAVTIVAFCLLGGAVGKSAQFPLQTWLPDAMLGPTPVSALIHAATMVTAGVYLIARMASLFELAPIAQMAVLMVGAGTLLIAGFSALVQTDLKRVLAYSTISQIGYMFLALGAGAYSAAMFHFVTHAFFKALLFLSAGAIGHVMHHEYSMLKMGGLRRQMPFIFGVFVVGGACLAALPFVTSGFYSKELILGQTFASPIAGVWPWAIGVFGAFLTGLYTVRMISMAFFGEARGHVTKKIDWKMIFPLVVLSVCALLAGYVQVPEMLANALPGSMGHLESINTEHILMAIASTASVAGMIIAGILYRRGTRVEKEGLIRRWLFAGWGFDAVYNCLLVKPFVSMSKCLRRDFVQGIYSGIGTLMILFHRALALTQTGQLRHAIIALVLAAVAISSWMVLS